MIVQPRMRLRRAARVLRAAHTSAQQLAAPQPAHRPHPPAALPAPPPDSARPPSPWASWIGATVNDLADRRLLRSLRAVEPVEGRPNHVRLSQWSDSSARPAASAAVLTVFAANDYLGLSTHPHVRQAAAAAAAAHGCGPRSSALVCGYTDAHARLEASLATLKQSEAAFLFPSGFAANTAVLGALASSPSCAIFSDALNHASIVDGARLAAKGAGAQLHIYRHRDLSHLSSLLSASAAPRKLIVSDSLFSMDGDEADVLGLVELKEQHGALLVLDEAHATLAYGPTGGGVAEAHGVAARVDVHTGNLSKAFGAHGGFVGCSDQVQRLLISTGRPGIYSTALPAPAVAAAAAALTLATPQLRAALRRNVHAFRHAIGQPADTAGGLARGVDSGAAVGDAGLDGRIPEGAGWGHAGCSPIVPIYLGTEEAALGAAARLQAAGFLVPAIRPPTVPPGTARLRVALSAAHTLGEIEAFARALDEMGVLRQRDEAAGGT